MNAIEPKLIHTVTGFFVRYKGKLAVILGNDGSPKRVYASAETIEGVQAMVEQTFLPELPAGLPVFIVTRIHIP